MEINPVDIDLDGIRKTLQLKRNRCDRTVIRQVHIFAKVVF